MSISAYPLQWPIGWKRTVDAQYEVRADGHIYRLPSGSRMPEHADLDGYLCVLVRIAPGKRRQLRVHRAVCETFHGPRPADGYVVRHLDGKKTNNMPGNLAWGTHAENEADAVRLGEKAKGYRNGAHTVPEHRPRGSLNGNSKLSDQAALAIFLDARPQSDIAKAHGVCQALVSQIKVGRVWNHVTGLPSKRSIRYPDRGGDPAKMAELNAARDEALKEVGP